MNNLKNIPSMDEILMHKEIKGLILKHNRQFVLDICRQAAGELRQLLKSRQDEVNKGQTMKMLLELIYKKIEAGTSGTLRRVINGTGVVLHTNLGRAPLGAAAIRYMLEIGPYYNNLEIDLEKGERGSRYGHVEELLVTLTGAEGALVVNNNAAAVLLGLNTIAKGKEVIVSRGQLIEIGGAFRIPEIMKLSGAILIEVGTTNKTYVSDYEQGMGSDTALLFAAHTSNYKIIGFSEEVKLEEMVKLGKSRGIPVMQDLGSGILYGLDNWGLKEEPTVQECVEAGADIITFSGDKLLGGPQAGIIVGKKQYLEAMKKNQLLRALRVDKLTIAALEGTLLEYLSGDPIHNVPVIYMLTLKAEELKNKSRILQEKLTLKLNNHKKIEQITVVEMEDMVGGGAYPTYKMPGFGVEIKFREARLEDIARRLRTGTPAVLTRKKDEAMLISSRTILPGEDDQVAHRIEQVLSGDL